jgi:hypothetical protein
MTSASKVRAKTNSIPYSTMIKIMTIKQIWVIFTLPIQYLTHLIFRNN